MAEKKSVSNTSKVMDVYNTGFFIVGLIAQAELLAFADIYDAIKVSQSNLRALQILNNSHWLAVFA